MGLGPLREIARVNHPIRSPSAFRPLTIEGEREEESVPRGLREPRFTDGPYPFLFCFHPFPSARFSYSFFSLSFLLLFLGHSRPPSSLPFCPFFRPLRISCFVCSLSKALLSLSFVSFSIFFAPVSFLSPLIADTITIFTRKQKGGG